MRPNPHVVRRESDPRPTAVPVNGAPVRYFPQDSESEGEEDIAFWETVTPCPSKDVLPVSVKGFKYINDTTLFQAAWLSNAVRHITIGEGLEELRNLAIEVTFENIIREAEKIGMKKRRLNSLLLVQKTVTVPRPSWRLAARRRLSQSVSSSSLASTFGRS